MSTRQPQIPIRARVVGWVRLRDGDQVVMVWVVPPNRRDGGRIYLEGAVPIELDHDSWGRLSRHVAKAVAILSEFRDGLGGSKEWDRLGPVSERRAVLRRGRATFRKEAP